MSESDKAVLGNRRANADYTVVDQAPIRLGRGDVVRLGDEDRAWTGWVWVTTGEGRGTYLPVGILERGAGAEARVTGDFDAVDLSVEKGEEVECLREVSGWWWCRSAKGTEGWVPDYILS